MGPFKRQSCGGAAASSAADKPVASKGDDSAKKRRLGRRNSEEQIERLVKERLPGISQVQLTQHEVKGDTLLARITKDHQNASQRGGRLSGVYWTRLRQEYGVESGPPLKVLNPDEKVQPALCLALSKAKHNNAAMRTKKDLIAFFATVGSLNQKEVVGLCKYLAELKIAGNEASSMCMSSAMKAFIRLKITEKYPEEQTSFMQYLMAGSLPNSTHNLHIKCFVLNS